MVELVEVEDESFETKQVGPEENEDDYYTDTESEISTDDEDEITEGETFVDRLRALRDIVPPTTRTYISDKVDTTTNFVKKSLFFSGSFLYVISTGALMLGVPWALAFAEEQGVIEMENEMKMREQGTKDIFAEGSTAAQLDASLNQPKPAL